MLGFHLQDEISRLRSSSTVALDLASLALAGAIREIAARPSDALLSPIGFRLHDGQPQRVPLDPDYDAVRSLAGERTWASASEHVWRYVEPAETVLAVEFEGAGMDAPATMLQPLQWDVDNNTYRRLGPTLLRLRGQVVDDASAHDTIAAIERGLRVDEAAERIWQSWREAAR